MELEGGDLLTFVPPC